MRFFLFRSSITIFISVLLILFSGCVSQTKDGPPRYYVDVSKIPNAKPQPLSLSKYGNPSSYVVHGKRYQVLKTIHGYVQRGIASWYGTKFHGQLTSTREPYNMLAMTGASPVLPIPCFVQVTNLSNGRSVIVKINDRGPFASHRIIDLSYAAAKKLGYANKGTAFVEVKAIDVYHHTSTQSIILKKSSTSILHSLHSSHLFLQLGAFRKATDAEILKRELSAYIIKPILILKKIYNQLPIYQVQIGPITNISESNYLHKKLKKFGFREPITIISDE
ncbi:septal ring lytic transglycosylase RlpA family protein [Coxiella endosymbiont of Rhipicephalus microplus]|uniref:septal ring lytic transglycosylase RlpA family protein n=1 Tax=Coxiella endosymbiont of Rhipicephalus microplus TaxID=1656186 RepID=UPI000C80E2C0|nr:septal ring lytic transglycosylase RlpA family protein [Coxiella endosymbiont of Rhipicephalus microplus]PMB54872.1 Rare lipoprotein A precursor [Coxiella-like endosymbiont]